MPQEASVRDAAKLREIRLKADRARALAWSAGDQLTYERLRAYADELEAEAMGMEAQKTPLPPLVRELRRLMAGKVAVADKQAER